MRRRSVQGKAVPESTSARAVMDRFAPWCDAAEKDIEDAGPMGLATFVLEVVAVVGYARVDSFAAAAIEMCSHLWPDDQSGLAMLERFFGALQPWSTRPTDAAFDVLVGELLPACNEETLDRMRRLAGRRLAAGTIASYERHNRYFEDECVANGIPCDPPTETSILWYIERKTNELSCDRVTSPNSLKQVLKALNYTAVIRRWPSAARSIAVRTAMENLVRTSGRPARKARPLSLKGVGHVLQERRRKDVEALCFSLAALLRGKDPDLSWDRIDSLAFSSIRVDIPHQRVEFRFPGMADTGSGACPPLTVALPMSADAWIDPLRYVHRIREARGFPSARSTVFNSPGQDWIPRQQMEAAVRRYERVHSAAAGSARDLIRFSRGVEQVLALRDDGLAVTGFFAGRRPSDSAYLGAADLQPHTHKLVLNQRRAKNDQDGHGFGCIVAAKPGAPYDPLRIVAEYKSLLDGYSGPAAWMTLAPGRGDIDRAFARAKPMTANAIAHRMKVLLGRAGYLEWSAYSLRRGFVTEAADNGASLTEIAAVTGSKRLDVLAGYIDVAGLTHNATHRVG